MTSAEREAMKWLSERGGDAVFERSGVALAMGETAPHRRQTWNALAKKGLVEFYNPSGKGRGRVRITGGGE